MNAYNFKSKRAALWLAGVFLLVGGFLAAAIVLPHKAEPYGAEPPEMQLPKMTNVPSEAAPKMELKLEEAPPAE